MEAGNNKCGRYYPDNLEFGKSGLNRLTKQRKEILDESVDCRDHRLCGRPVYGFLLYAADAQNYSYKRCAELVSGQLYSLLYRDFILGVIRILRPFGSNGGF